MERAPARPVATVVLDHPERKNAITRAMWHQLVAAFDAFALEAPATLRAVVIRGNPAGNAFCPGADLTEFPELRGTTEKALLYKDLTHQALEAVDRCPCPVVAAIDGPCIGAGLEIAMASDLRLATERSTFALPVVRLSNTAAVDDVARLARTIGGSLAAELLYTAATLPAPRLYAAGALAWSGPADALDAALDGVVERLVTAAPKAVRLAKQALRQVLGGGPVDSDAYEAGVRAVLSGYDFAEGTQAFLERRPPRFTGS